MFNAQCMIMAGLRQGIGLTHDWALASGSWLDTEQAWIEANE